MGMSTLSPNSFTDSLSWEFNYYDSFNGEEENDSEVLTALVRTSYLKHLQRSLTRNYDHWLEFNKDQDDLKCCRDDIMKCANFLEHKALRACMITSYYQRAMVKTMREIKESTEEGSLFSPLIEQLFDKKNYSKKTCDKETQTNISFASSKNDDKNHEIQEIQAPTVDITLENSNLIIINPCNELIKEKETNDDLEDLISILMSSPNFPEKEAKEKFLSPKKRKYNEEPVSFSIRCKEEPVHFQHHDPCHEESTSICSQYINEEAVSCEEKYNETETPYDHMVPNNNQKPTFVEESLVFEEKDVDSIPELVSKNPNLDERLQTLAALFGDDSSSPAEAAETTISNEYSQNIAMDTNDSAENPDWCKYPSDWKTELAAQSCHLKTILSMLSPRKRYILKRRFRELFGYEHSFHINVSANEEALCRKRTANIVVGELTPHYIAGKIASREIFKSLAKKITDDILLLSFVTGHEEISRRVNWYFENGRCINSVKDIENTNLMGVFSKRLI